MIAMPKNGSTMHFVKTRTLLIVALKNSHAIIDAINIRYSTA